MPASVDLPPIRQGDTYALEFAFEVGEPAAPLDLTGAVPRLQLRDRPGGTLVLDASPFIIVAGDATAGLATLALPAATTAAIPTVAACGGTAYAYDLEVALAGGTVLTWIAGTVLVEPQVTA